MKGFPTCANCFSGWERALACRAGPLSGPRSFTNYDINRSSTVVRGPRASLVALELQPKLTQARLPSPEQASTTPRVCLSSEERLTA